MGRFKDGELNTLERILISKGYEYTEDGVTGVMGGYERSYRIKGGSYVWVTINIEECKIHINKEYECGGEISSCFEEFDESIKENEEDFIDKIDEILTPYIG